MYETLFDADDFDWAADAEEMYEQRAASGSEQGTSSVSSVSSYFQNASASESQVSPISPDFGSSQAIGEEHSSTIHALDLATKEDIEEHTEKCSELRLLYWLEFREENFHIIDRWVTSYAPSWLDNSNTDLESVIHEPKRNNFHHLNFHNEPQCHQNSTPPEVSLWLAVSSRILNQKFRGKWREFVLASQAGKLIDPVRYDGPRVLLGLHGTTLRDAVTGYVSKAYQPRGTWGLDVYSSDEAPPACATGTDFRYNQNNHKGPPKPYLLQPEDSERFVVNDDGRVHAPIRNRWKPLPGRSGLCNVENADDEDSMTSNKWRFQEEDELVRAIENYLKTRHLPGSLDREIGSMLDDHYNPFS